MAAQETARPRRAFLCRTGSHREVGEAIDVLQTNPLIGWAAGDAKRELVSGRGAHGYLALYYHVVQIDTVFVLAVRSQREAGFAGP
ncbi:hypothetical protein XaplCFBP3122_08595 [Xanthomonas arboricola pv. populi]|uniref:Plasmid stabilization protein n=1 Tax=Xanthomonas arboricola pv. populi TaxID=487823 RepID=A0A2S6Z612_9XANT|nr:hypothetical protein XaplCFBP3122_08595 [Xanthomonas arboricola pv. populi]